MTVAFLALEHNTLTLPGLKPRLLDPDSSALTTRPPRLLLTLTYHGQCGNLYNQELSTHHVIGSEPWFS